MDGQRFDEVARLIGTGASRRRVLKGLATGLLGLGGAGLSRRGAAALPSRGDCIPTGSPCASDDNECCGGGDGAIVCAGVPRSCEQTASCVGETGPCNPTKGLDCCEGMVCNVTDGDDGDCKVPAPTCGEEQDDCLIDDDCCEGLVCVSESCVVPLETCESDDDCDGGLICCTNGKSATCLDKQCCGIGDDEHCAVDQVCNQDLLCVSEAPGDECAVDDDCNTAQGAVQATICCGGVCVQNECCIEDENPNARCPEGTACFEGICDTICRDDGDCDGDSCCCPDGTCSTDCCNEPTPVPVDNGGTTETPTTLPATGSGQDASGSGLLGAGLLAAGAAFVAGKKLRPRDEA